MLMVKVAETPLCPGCGAVMIRHRHGTLECLNQGCKFKGRRFRVPEVPIELIQERDEDIFTLKQIKAAFWQEFHKSGERFFKYCETDEKSEESTRAIWSDFFDALQNPKPKEDANAHSRNAESPGGPADA